VAALSPDGLFEDGKEPDKAVASASSGWHGFVQFELACTYASPAHWLQFLTRAELAAQSNRAAQGERDDGIHPEAGSTEDVLVAGRQKHRQSIEWCPGPDSTKPDK
jgi:hypothetical protein